MTEKQRQTAEELLNASKMLTFDETGVVIQKHNSKDGYPALFYHGSEAVCIYRQILGLPDASIRSIPVDEILQQIDNYDDLYDILHFIYNINLRNERIQKLISLNVPTIIQIAEYRVLQEYVEFMEDNYWCGKPINHQCNYGKEEPPFPNAAIKKSLADIGLSLLPQENDNE